MRNVQLNGQPIAPSKIICIGRNYLEHIQELNSEVAEEPVIFMKPNSAIAEQVYVGSAQEVHYEAEICFMVQQGQIAALGFGLDLTKRDLQRKLKAKGLPWERSKAFKNSAVFTEFKSFKGDVESLRMEFLIDGVTTQEATTQLMIYQPATLLSEVSQVVDWEDGDIIMTGTPKGVGLLLPGKTLVGKLFLGDDLLVQGEWFTQI